jgi:DNA repair exonuclease SbcCD ATPase subunit
VKIIELRSQNVKRLKAVEIRPNGQGLVIVGGMNGQGKSSVLDSIWYALGGKGALPPKPVREGEEEATIILDLGEYVVTRTITTDGKSTLKVTGKDGGRLGNPQSILDSLVGRLSFDPLEFLHMNPKAQADTLKVLLGLDFTELDRQKAAKSEERLLVGREVKQLQGHLHGLPQHPDAPSDEVSVAALSKELSEARQENGLRLAAMSEAQKAANSFAEWTQHVASLTKELEDAKEQVTKWEKIAKERKQAAIALPTRDEQAIIDKMGDAEGINRKVRENRERVRIAQHFEQKQAAYDKLTTQLEALDAQKTEALQEAEFPVKGLSFDESSVLVNGIPFQQASGAEQLRVSVAMGLALNPKLKVLLVRDGSLLDAKSLEMLATMAAEGGAQVWLERVGEGDEKAVIIEDGHVVERRTRELEPA